MAETEILALVDDSESADQHHWAITKLCGWLRKEKYPDLSYRTLVRYLHEHNYARRISPRFPIASKPEEWKEKRETFVKQLLELLEAPDAEVFFGDEALASREIPGLVKNG